MPDREHLVELASRDSLTGLYNRAHFLEKLAEEISRVSRHKHSIALMMIDIDRFKRVNDLYGHATGDLALKGFADLIARQIRGSDVMCRYGGEEFALLLPETGIAGAKIVAEKIRRTTALYDFKASLGISLVLA